MSASAVVLAAAVALTPPSVGQERRFGISMAERGLWREAQYRFERALERSPDDGKAWNNLAVVREQLGDFDGARAAYEKALELRPRDSFILQNYDMFSAADEKRTRRLMRPREARRGTADGRADGGTDPPRATVVNTPTSERTE